MKYFVVLIIALGLCGCKGRTASVPDANGDTVEVVLTHPEPTSTTEGVSDSTADVNPESVAEPSEAPDLRPDEVPVSSTGEQGIEKAAGVTKRIPQGDPSF